MKAMKNFAVQQLSKKQMNEAKGGTELFYCTWEGGSNYLTFKQIQEAAMMADKLTMHCVPA